jgi:multidrug transporter EmrE-like cation transporter
VALTVYAVVYTTLATAGLVLLRRSLADAPLDELLRDPAFFLGGVCYAVSFATFLLSLRHFDVLTVFPLFTGLAYASVAVAASLVLDESLTASRLAGIALVGVGAVLLVR